MREYVGLPTSVHSQVSKKENCILFESGRCDRENYRTYLFTDPVAIIKIHSLHEMPGLFSCMEDYRRQNYYLAGYLSYECGYHFEQVAAGPRFPLPHPLAWFGVYSEPIIFNHRENRFEGRTPELSDSAVGFVDGFELDTLEFSIPRPEYYKKIARIKHYISQGDVYQINLTGKYRFRFRGSPLSLYCMLKKRQSVSYAAFVQADGFSLVSLSPELFFRVEDGIITTKPMKGTLRRGKTFEEDNLLRDFLQRSEKNRAENVMIVDLLRNDIGRISKKGSVRVPELFSVETYQTLFQMTSTVQGTLTDNVTYHELFKAVFPGGSITGAPKVRSMQIIHELEEEPRGIYTGALGFFTPAGKAVFNIPIRTVIISDGRGEMGTGGGIVWDSEASSEYEECLLKADFLTKPYEDFELIETMLWDGGFFLLDKHLERLDESARYFDYPMNVDALTGVLEAESKKFRKNQKYRVRLTLNAQGKFFIRTGILNESLQNPCRVFISCVRTNSSDAFFYHKTTRRDVYDRLHDDAKRKGFADVIFLNEKGQVTEGAISNVFIKRGETYLTPPVDCGLLKGVYRQHLLETLPKAEEAILSVEDLEEADALFICNSVRGLRKARLVKQESA